MLPTLKSQRERYCYILTYSFPCQDLSLAGKGKGFSKGSGTRSGLLWEIERILDECNGNLPQVLLMENVSQVHSKGENMDNFQMWLKKLRQLGYSNFFEDLNSKDYGIPQNRKRTFCVSILGDYTYKFPKPFELKLRLKDMLEDNVDEKYYLSDDKVNYFVQHTVEQKEKGNGFTFDPIDIERERESSTNSQHELITDRQHIYQGKVNVLGNHMPSNHEAGRVFDVKGAAPTIKENHGTIYSILENGNSNN